MQCMSIQLNEAITSNVVHAMYMMCVWHISDQCSNDLAAIGKAGRAAPLGPTSTVPQLRAALKSFKSYTSIGLDNWTFGDMAALNDDSLRSWLDIRHRAKAVWD